MAEDHRPKAATRFTYTVMASTLHDRAAVQAAISPVTGQLAELGGVEDEPSQESPHCYLVATGGSEKSILDAVEQRRPEAPGEPVVLVAHREQNALPAALETLAALQQEGIRGRVVQAGSPDDVELVRLALKDLEVVHKFRHCRVGLIGKPSEWLVASTPTAETVVASWGPSLVPVQMPEVMGTSRATPVVLGRTLATRFASNSKASADGHHLPPSESVERAAHLHPVLEQVSQEHQLDAVTVRCFDFLTDLNTSGCVALAELNDSGFVAGCEGDVPSTLALLLARYLLDQPGWIANPASLDPLTNEIELAHCTVAPSMVESMSLSTHFESGIGVGIHGTFGPGPVTLIRIGGQDLDLVWLAEGQIVASGAKETRCRTQATIQLSDGLVQDLLDRPLGNHLVMIAGHHRARMGSWWRFAVGRGGSG